LDKKLQLQFSATIECVSKFARVFIAIRFGRSRQQGCQMVSFQTKNTNLGKFWSALDWKMLIYFTAIWNILQPFGTFYEHCHNFVFIWYIFSGFGIMYQEKSGNPGRQLGRKSVLVSFSKLCHEEEM
jgi:hypothetical protein